MNLVGANYASLVTPSTLRVTGILRPAALHPTRQAARGPRVAPPLPAKPLLRGESLWVGFAGVFRAGLCGNLPGRGALWNKLRYATASSRTSYRSLPRKRESLLTTSLLLFRAKLRFARIFSGRATKKFTRARLRRQFLGKGFEELLGQGLRRVARAGLRKKLLGKGYAGK